MQILVVILAESTQTLSTACAAARTNSLPSLASRLRMAGGVFGWQATAKRSFQSEDRTALASTGIGQSGSSKHASLFRLGRFERPCFCTKAAAISFRRLSRSDLGTPRSSPRSARLSGDKVAKYRQSSTRQYSRFSRLFGKGRLHFDSVWQDSASQLSVGVKTSCGARCVLSIAASTPRGSWHRLFSVRRAAFRTIALLSPLSLVSVSDPDAGLPATDFLIRATPLSANLETTVAGVLTFPATTDLTSWSGSADRAARHV